MTKLASLFASLIIVLATMTGASAQPTQPVSQPASEPASFDSYYLHSASLWASETLDNFGIVPASNVHFEFTNTNNCGAEISEVGQGGCTTHNADGTITVRVSHSLAYSEWGTHILIHEYAHTLGYGECGAEAYAHSYEGNTNLWSYPSCEEQAGN